MRYTLSVLCLLAAMLAVGCAREASMTTAPVVQGSDPGAAETAVRAQTDAERAVLQEIQQLSSENNGVVSHIATSVAEFDVPAGVFGTTTPIDNRLLYVAIKKKTGETNGVFSYTQAFDGESFSFSGKITCMEVYDFDGGTGNRAKLGGRIDQSNDPTIPVGTYIWWQTIDNGNSPGTLPDKSTLSGFGDNAANEAFCANPNPPRFGPWDVDKGDIRIRALGNAIASN
jgi:hypothetical protein